MEIIVNIFVRLFFKQLSMNLIQFLAMKLHQGPVWWYGEFNRGRTSLKNELREGCPNLVVVPETVDALRQLILQDGHVTYCRIETTLDINGTSIHSILHEHLVVKQIALRWIPHNLPIAQKKARVD